MDRDQDVAQVLNKDAVAIIGGGYAGLAAAVELSNAGIPVDVYEASRTLGGRARRADTGNAENVALDNGQHILVGAYRETLRLMALVGANPDALLQRLDLHLEYPGTLRIHAPDWPAPLHMAAALLGAKGLNWREKWAAIRFMQYLKARHFKLEVDGTVTALLDQLLQPAKLRRYLWEPLCVATLNTPANTASAQVFANVLRDTLGADKAASQLLLPKVDLSELFPEPAARFIEAKGGQVLRSRRIGTIAQNVYGGEQGWRVDGVEKHYRYLILATAPHHLSPLLGGFPQLARLADKVGALHYEPIVTVYLQYPATVRLPQPMIGGFAEGDGLSQWLFDRGQLLDNPGLLAAVISATVPHEALKGDELAAVVHQEITRLLPDLPMPLWQQVITEKRATFACTPGLGRLATTTPLPGLLLAGDHIASDYPATIESAVRSGIEAARRILQTPSD
ncbi:MAG TPA: hydroxysqualene dehydroxylase HpnE [Rhodocyclaceae bacterium]